MSKKTKIFKKLFDENADDVCKNKKHTISRETFVPVAGEIYDKAKVRYFNRNTGQTMKFAEWAATNFVYNEYNKQWHGRIAQKETYTTKKLFKIWRKNERDIRINKNN